MTFKEILKQIAAKENVSTEEIESEMEVALSFAGLDCSAEEFVEFAAALINQDYI